MAIRVRLTSENALHWMRADRQPMPRSGFLEGGSCFGTAKCRCVSLQHNRTNEVVHHANIQEI